MPTLPTDPAGGVTLLGTWVGVRCRVRGRGFYSGTVHAKSGRARYLFILCMFIE